MDLILIIIYVFELKLKSILFYLGLPLPGRENGDTAFFCNINEKKLHEYPGYNVPSHPDAVDVRIIID